MHSKTIELGRLPAFIVFLLATISGGCRDYGGSMSPTDLDEVSSTQVLSSTVEQTVPEARTASAEKVVVCHKTEGAKGYIPIEIAAAAVPAHLAHGDGLVGDPVPGTTGMIFDEECYPIFVEQMLFDNGYSSGSQSNMGNTVGGQELFEDFTTSQDIRITKIAWQQHDHKDATYVSTEILVFAGLPFSAPPVFSETVSAMRTPNATGTLFDAWEGYDYEAEGLSIDLPPGTYWIGLNANFDGVRSGWDNTTGGPNAILGYRIVNINFPAPGKVSNGNLAFQLFGYPR